MTAEQGTGFTVEDLTRALENVCILLLVIVSEACTTLAHRDHEGAFVVLGLHQVCSASRAQALGTVNSVQPQPGKGLSFPRDGPLFPQL